MPEFDCTADRLIRGAYDLHMHAAPSPFHRAMDDFGLLEEAGRAGMAGIVLKSHYEPTAARAELVNTHCSSCCTAYGAIALNWPVGGLNPYAVENALRRNARIVWMPTRDSANSLLSGNMPGDFFDRPGISAVDESGRLKPEVYQILEIAKKYNAVVATGHLSAAESILLCRKGREQGVRMILTHPEFDRTVVDAATQKEMADLGVFIEKCWQNIGDNICSAEEMASHIRQVGAEHCFLVTDRGQGDRERPVEALGRYFTALLRLGLTEDQLYTMSHTVPAQVLGLSA